MLVFAQLCDLRAVCFASRRTYSLPAASTRLPARPDALALEPHQPVAALDAREDHLHTARRTQLTARHNSQACSPYHLAHYSSRHSVVRGPGASQRKARGWGATPARNRKHMTQHPLHLITKLPFYYPIYKITCISPTPR